MARIEANTKPGEAYDGLRVEDLEVHYPRPGLPDVSALGPLTFSLKSGEALGVLGVSGSGKSTLALALAGLLPTNARVQARGIELGERSLLGLSEHAWRRVRGAEIGCVFQQPFLALCPWRRVGDQLQDVLAAHHKFSRRQRQERAGELLEEVGLDAALAAAFPHQLSGGQRQRIVFCQAIAAGPRLLIADEPTAALDEKTCDQVLELVAKLRRRLGLAILWISHDADILARVADRLLVLDAGQKVEEGSADRVFTSPEAPATRMLLEARSAPQVTSPAAKPEVLVQARELTIELGRGRFLERRRAKQTLLSNIHLELRRGEMLGIYGASGSGKTTLLRCLAGLLEPTHGRVEIAGQDFAPASSLQKRRLRRQIQWVGQDPARVVDPRWPLWRIVSEGAAANPEAPERSLRQLRATASAAMAPLGLGEDLLDRRPLEVSGGQLQRVVLARAIACGARALLLDEAFSALDLPRRRALLELLLELRQKHDLALLFVSHQKSWLQSFCTRTLEMSAGRFLV